jgi:two-component system sensor histidine kinase HydH
MLNKIKNRQILAGVSPWLLIGAVAILLPIFALMTMTSITRQREKSTRLLLEKGAALIRSFEAGTRTGMRDMHRGGFKLQHLLTETAQQPDIVYLMVANSDGTIIAHNNLYLVGTVYDGHIDLKKVAQTDTLLSRIHTHTDGTRVFDVYRQFSPSEPSFRMMHRSQKMRHRMQSHFNKPELFPGAVDNPPRVIFVGLDMTSVEQAHRADIRHAVIMGVILLLVGFAGIALLFLFQSYRATRTSLSRIKAFSDNVVENMPIGLIALDDQQRIAAYNHTAESILQCDFRDAIGKAAERVVPQELFNEIKGPKIRQYIIEKEVTCTVGSGKIVPLEIGASLLKDENRTLLGYVILFKDLSEVRRLRREIERSRRLASVGSLAAGVAHEIRNPLSSIKGFATYFKERYQQVPEDRETADIMIQEVDRLNRVVSQLLEFARPVKVSPQKTALHKLIDDSISLIEQRALEKQITINNDTSAQIREIFIDPDRMSQILLNLYLNAIESMAPGGELGIRIANTNAQENIEIRVSDTGCGIEADDLSKIFDPYFTTKSSGTGLGLAIVHNILEAMGGGIRVKSRPGEGTTFRITIPIPDKPKKTKPK